MCKHRCERNRKIGKPIVRRRKQFAHDTFPLMCTDAKLIAVTRFSTVEKRRRGLATLISNLSGILLKGPFRGLARECPACATPHACTQPNGARGTRGTNLDLSHRTMTRPWGRCWQGRSARGTTDECQHLPAAIGVWRMRPVQPTHPSFI